MIYDYSAPDWSKEENITLSPTIIWPFLNTRYDFQTWTSRAYTHEWRCLLPYYMLKIVPQHPSFYLLPMAPWNTGQGNFDVMCATWELNIQNWPMPSVSGICRPPWFPIWNGWNRLVERTTDTDFLGNRNNRKFWLLIRFQMESSIAHTAKQGRYCTVFTDRRPVDFIGEKGSQVNLTATTFYWMDETLDEQYVEEVNTRNICSHWNKENWILWSSAHRQWPVLTIRQRWERRFKKMCRREFHHRASSTSFWIPLRGSLK